MIFYSPPTFLCSPPNSLSIIEAKSTPLPSPHFHYFSPSLQIPLTFHQYPPAHFTTCQPLTPYIFFLYNKFFFFFPLFSIPSMISPISYLSADPIVFFGSAYFSYILKFTSTSYLIYVQAKSKNLNMAFLYNVNQKKIISVR